MPYSEPSDLLIGDLTLGSTVDTGKVVASASEEMDSKLGWVYELPLRAVLAKNAERPDPDDWTALPVHEKLLLKTINNRLASGRLILAVAMSGEDTSLNAYGASLVKEALADLYTLANGDVDLTAIRSVQVGSESLGGPSIANQDDESLLLGFERTVLKSQPWYSRPGAL